MLGTRTATRARRSVRFAGIFAVWGMLAAAGGILASIPIAVATGARPLTVLSGSMEPTLHTGDVAVAERISPADARPGDVVTFRDPEHQGRLITHRVQAIRVKDGRFNFTTKGDANNTAEKWSVREGGELGRTKLHLPYLGYVFSFAGGNGGRFALIALPALLLAGFELARIWRPRKEGQADAPAA